MVTHKEYMRSCKCQPILNLKRDNRFIAMLIKTYHNNILMSNIYISSEEDSLSKIIKHAIFHLCMICSQNPRAIKGFEANFNIHTTCVLVQ